MKKNASAAEPAQANARRRRFRKCKFYRSETGTCGEAEIALPASLFLRKTMAKHFFSYIAGAFSQAAKALGLIAACALAGFVLTLPLWRFATSLPSLYTALVLVFSGGYILYKIAAAVKKSTWKRTLCFVLRIVIIASGLAASIALVFAGARFIAIPVLIIIPLLCIICSRLLQDGQ